MSSKDIKRILKARYNKDGKLVPMKDYDKENKDYDKENKDYDEENKDYDEEQPRMEI
jgi:hypothetical protein